MPVTPGQPGQSYQPWPWRRLVSAQPPGQGDTFVNYPTGLYTQLVRRPYRSQGTVYGFVYPTVVSAATVAPVLSSIRVVSAASQSKHRSSTYRLQKPSVVGPGIVFPPVKVALAGSVRNARQPKSRLLAPTVVGPGKVFRPIQVALTRTARVLFKTTTSLRGVKVVGMAPGPPVVTSVRVSLAVSLRPTRKTISYLGAPTIVGAALAAVKGVLRTFLTAQPAQTRHVGRYGAASPQIVDLLPTPDQLVISTTLAPSQRRFKTVTILKRPVVSAPSVPKYTDRSRIVLAAAHRLSRRSRPKLTPPVVVNPFVPPPVVIPVPVWSPFVDVPENRNTYTAPELWYQRRKR